MSGLARLGLFASSYAPLLALFALLDSFGPGLPSIVCAALAALTTVWLGILVFSWRKRSVEWVDTVESRNRDADVMSFFITYVLPFASAQAPDSKARVALLVFAVLTAAIYVRSATIYVHPILLLVGFHVYDVQDEEGVTRTLLTRKRRLRQRGRIAVSNIADGLLLERGEGVPWRRQTSRNS